MKNEMEDVPDTYMKIIAMAYMLKEKYPDDLTVKEHIERMMELRMMKL